MERFDPQLAIIAGIAVGMKARTIIAQFLCNPVFGNPVICKANQRTSRASKLREKCDKVMAASQSVDHRERRNDLDLQVFGGNLTRSLNEIFAVSHCLLAEQLIVCSRSGPTDTTVTGNRTNSASRSMYRLAADGKS